MSMKHLDDLFGKQYAVLPDGRRVQICMICKGTGECDICEGTGRDKLLGLYGPRIGRTCHSCHGTGLCRFCGGRGWWS